MQDFDELKKLKAQCIADITEGGENNGGNGGDNGGGNNNPPGELEG